MRLKQIGREQRDLEVDKLNDRYAKRLQTLEDRLRRLDQSVARKQADADARKREVAVSVGESVLGMFLGRRSTRVASTALSKYRQSRSASMTVEQDKATAENLRREIDELKKELREEATVITDRWDQAASKLEQVPLRPSRNDVQVHLFALAWAPHWQITYNDQDKSPHTVVQPAFKAD
jgi:small-conductance mechanosensitive channel